MDRTKASFRGWLVQGAAVREARTMRVCVNVLAYVCGCLYKLSVCMYVLHGSMYVCIYTYT